MSKIYKASHLAPAGKYKCVSCGYPFRISEDEKVMIEQCPSCGSKLFEKV
jgi:DNA-directed RNA polymerase subunit RPC12/RpoP